MVKRPPMEKGPPAHTECDTVLAAGSRQLKKSIRKEKATWRQANDRSNIHWPYRKPASESQHEQRQQFRVTYTWLSKAFWCLDFIVGVAGISIIHNT